MSLTEKIENVGEETALPECSSHTSILSAIVIVASLLMINQSFASGAGTTGADFLTINADARSAGMAGASSSLSGSASSAYWNPAGLAGISGINLIGSHFQWYQDMTFEYLAAAVPITPAFTLAADASYLNYGTIEGYDRFDQPLGEVSSVYDFAGGLSLGYAFSDNIAAGFSCKYLVLSLGEFSATTVTFDAGLQFRFHNATLGAAIAHLGKPVTFHSARENLPTTLRLGGAVRPFGPAALLVVDLERRFDGRLAAHSGIEVSYEDRFFLRSGYAINPNDEGGYPDRAASLGAGLAWGITAIDYAFSPSRRVKSESLHQFTISFNF